MTTSIEVSMKKNCVKLCNIINKGQMQEETKILQFYQNSIGTSVTCLDIDIQTYVIYTKRSQYNNSYIRTFCQIGAFKNKINS